MTETCLTMDVLLAFLDVVPSVPEIISYSS